MTRTQAKKIAIAFLVKRSKDDGVFENIIFRAEHGLTKDPRLIRHGIFGLTLVIEEHEIVIGDHVVFDLRTDPSLYWWTVRGVYDNVVWCSTATAGRDIRQEFPIRAITGKAGKDSS